MSVTRNSRFFKFILIAFVVTIFIVIATRHTVLKTSDLDNQEYPREFLPKTSEEEVVNPNQETTNNNENQENAIKVEEDKNSDNAAEVVDNIEVVSKSTEDIQDTVDETMPGAYLKNFIPAATNKSYCKFNYDLPYDLIYNSKVYLSPPEFKKNSLFKILYNAVEAHNISDVPQVTYATHMTANYAYFILELLKRWEGLISVAAFVPDLDSALYMEQITQYCYCEPEMHRVSIHLVTHKLLAFSKKDMNFFRPDNCIVKDSLKIGTFKDFDDTIIYPINVVRNVARTSALTTFVLVSDVELMPSKGLISKFLGMIKNYNKTDVKEVYALPLFEVEKTATVPDSKDQLLKLLNANQAVYYHEKSCPQCQKFPEIEEWLTNGYSDEIRPFIKVKRQGAFFRWDPVFIGTNADPLYSEKLSWEGLYDKIIHSLEMCLQDYNYTILDNAFLCHWPGIKQESDQEWRLPFIEQNQIEYTEIIENLLKKYKNIPECKGSWILDRVKNNLSLNNEKLNVSVTDTVVDNV
ncbi:hypothetical protein ABEB36_006018 [Hypothenemus hampei]|uniref:N-acetyllactosaminide beta-1,3-N-acetylglucosaminyltransferase n=1 Tax=Hypothenemus hampei TaxID=57062 RepID=A0ABD1F2V7_HYPHA